MKNQPLPATKPLLAQAAPMQVFPSPLAVAAKPAPATAPAPAIHDLPFIAVPVSGGAPSYPPELAADGRTARVVATCIIQADGTPTNCRVSGGRNPAAFSTAALNWLNHGRVRFRPVTQQGQPAATTQTWAINLSEPASAIAEARRLAREESAVAAAAAPAAPSTSASAALPAPARAMQLAPQAAMARQVLPSPEPADSDRPFSPRAIKGGAPTYPEEYDDARSARISVQCTILEDGRPYGCSVLDEAGGKAFSKSVLRWLNSGRVRYAPIIEGGRPVIRSQSWAVEFRPPQ